MPQNDVLKMLLNNEERLKQTETRETPGNISGFTSFYATGTFVPTFIGSTIAGTFTYSTQNGNYTRIGNIVSIRAHIIITAIAVAPTGNLQLGGLPFTASTPDPGTMQTSDYTGITLGAGFSQLGARVAASGVVATLTKSGSAVTAVFIQGAALALIAGAAEIVYGGVYQVV